MAKRTTKGKAQEIVIEESMTLDNITEIVNQYNKLIQKHDTISIKTKEPLVNMDLNAIQALQYFKQSAAKFNKQLSLQIEVEDGAKDLIEKSGFNEFLETLKS